MRKYLLSLFVAVIFIAPPAWRGVSPAWAQDPPARTIPYFTQRNRTDDPNPESFYGDQRGTLEAGYCDVAERPLPMLSPLADIAPFHIPEEILRVDAVRPTPVDTVLDALHESAEGQSLVLYTHGYFVDFDKGCRRATLLRERASMEGRFLWFSWPSDGNLLNYTLDEADLLWSVLDLEHTISRLESRAGSGQVNLMGHSLGARGLVMALYYIAGNKPDIRLGDVVLLAPDMDFDIFARLLPRLRPVVRSITVYVAQADWPLALSAQMHGYPRLGQTGNDVAQLDGVDVIDLSDLQVRTPTGHLYHIYNDEVASDIDQIFNAGLDAGARRGLLPAGKNLWRLQPNP